MASQHRQEQRQRGPSSCVCYPDEFNSFLRSRICDIDTLRATMAHANFVAMDTEHYDEQKFSSIGLAFVSGLEPVEHPIHPASLTGASEDHEDIHQSRAPSQNIGMTESFCFNIRGFERSHPTSERSWGQVDQDVDAEAINFKVTEAIQQFKEARSEKSLVLVTYSARAELTAISNLFPQLCGLFSAWVDMQPLVLQAYHKNAEYTRLDGLSISLRYAMRTLGFTTGYQPSNLHHAGNDALRTLVIMACVTHENVTCSRLKELEHVIRVNRYRKEQRRLRGTERDRGLHRKRPGPPSQHPHVAKVSMASTTGLEKERRPSHHQGAVMDDQEGGSQLDLPPVDVYRPDQTWDYFSPYEPNAIGRVCREECYYVCVGSETILRQLISDLDRTPACSGAYCLVVEDVSDLHALGVSKREERAEHRRREG